MATNIETKPKVETVQPILASMTCQMCLKEDAKYTCPRCNMGYCCVACYQSEKHSSCSEAFYKDWVMDELKETSAGPDEKKKVMEMLMKDLEDKANEDSADEDTEDDLAERLAGLDLDKDISAVWGRLTRTEKEQFARMLQDGRLAKLIEIWTPWWQRKENLKLVLEDQSKSMEGSGVPEVIPDIPDINNLLKTSKPSSNCRFDVLNILHSYAYVTRLHNGSHLECPVDASQDLLDISSVLQKGFQCGSVGEAVQAAQDAILQKAKTSGPSSPSFNLTLLKDVQALVKGPGKDNSITFVWAVLSDTARLCKAALSVIRKELKSRDVKEENVSDLRSMKSTLFKAEKKLTFLLSWSQRYGSSLHQLLPLLQFEIETRESEMEQVEDIKSAVEEHMDKLKPNQTETDTDSLASLVKSEDSTVTRKLIEEMN